MTLLSTDYAENFESSESFGRYFGSYTISHVMKFRDDVNGFIESDIYYIL